MLNMITATASTVAAFEIVSGIITTKAWTCCRSVLARLISWPVCTSSWNAKCRRWRWAKIRSRSTASDQRASRKAIPPSQAAADPRDHAGDEDRERPTEQRGVAVVTDASVDRDRDQGGDGDLRGGPGQACDDPGGEAPPLLPQLGAHETPSRPAGLGVLLRSSFHGFLARQPALDRLVRLLAEGPLQKAVLRADDPRRATSKVSRAR